MGYSTCCTCRTKMLCLPEASVLEGMTQCQLLAHQHRRQHCIGGACRRLPSLYNYDNARLSKQPCPCICAPAALAGVSAAGHAEAHQQTHFLQALNLFSAYRAQLFPECWPENHDKLVPHHMQFLCSTLLPKPFKPLVSWRSCSRSAGRKTWTCRCRITSHFTAAAARSSASGCCGRSTRHSTRTASRVCGGGKVTPEIRRANCASAEVVSRQMQQRPPAHKPCAAISQQN